MQGYTGYYGGPMDPNMMNMNPQQRLMFLEQQRAQQQQAPMFLKGRLVANAAEANAAMIDLDGTPFFFPNANGNEIYMKQVGLDGNAPLITFQRVQQPVVAPVQAPAQEEKSEPWAAQIQQLQAEVNTLKEELRNVQSYASGFYAARQPEPDGALTADVRTEPNVRPGPANGSRKNPPRAPAGGNEPG